MITMKRIILILIVLILAVSPAVAQNVTIEGVSFEIPHEYENGRVTDSSYVYQSGFTFRILSLSHYPNLRFNFGSDYIDCDSSEQTVIDGRDAYVIHDHYENRNYTTVYFPSGNTIFLICFNDTEVNAEIEELIASTPPQEMTHDEFGESLEKAVNDYQDQLAQEEAEYELEEIYRQNQPEHRSFLFLWI